MADAFDLPKGDLMKGKKGLIMGLADSHSIAFGIAEQMAAQGADLAISYMEQNERRAKPLAESVGALPISCDVADDASMDAAFAEVEKSLEQLDFMVHAIAMADRDQLQGSFVENTTRDGFHFAMDISVYSFVDATRRAAKLMPNGGSIMTLTYLGAERPMPNYNMMGVAKAALESAVRYAARDLGPQKIRVNAISAGAIRTLSLAGISGGRSMHAKSAALSALKEHTAIESVAGCALWLASDLGRSATGEVVHVDAGIHMMGPPEELL
ncbi:MAG TPA: enoyl-ACP reductase [Caulobacteraceae bacterium]|nr:enoyl-ACP reductase [Caulobacteraceae bacterium]